VKIALVSLTLATILAAAVSSALAGDPGTTKGIIDISKPERPADAVTLVGPDGYHLVPEGEKPTKWVFADGILTASPVWDSVLTKESYEDFRMHVEFNVNEVKDAKDPEADGNSGIYIQQRYEIQILNSFGVPAADYKPSYCGSIYRQKRPDRFVCKKAGEWQSFDFVFRAARFDGEKKTENARITVYQNGELIHDDYSITGKTGVGEKEGPEPRPVKLQGHHNPVRFRNVWIQKLTLDAKAAQPAATAATVSAAEKTAAQQGKPLPRVLLIGDSICGGYQKVVKQQLAGKADVVVIPGNGEYTGTGIKKLDEWLGDGKWDAIHFNWGLWDMYGWEYAKEDRSPATYQKRLEALVLRLEKTGAKLIWATTTPVCPAAETTMLKRFKTELRIAPDIERQYLDAAQQVMQKHTIRIDDLHALMAPELSKHAAGPDNVHFTGAGYGILGKQVAVSILAALAERPAATTASVGMMQEDFLKLKFGMFIHFNMATYKGVQWVAGYHSPADFNPGGKIDTDAWADAAVSAGMKYAVLTAKHVAGFCLWDSKYTTYDVMNPACPYQQDLVAQFIKSFKSRGLKVGLYYCWRNPGFKQDFKVLPPECDPATHSAQEQNDFQKKQLTELIEKYPDVFYIWNDGLDPTIMPAAEALAFIRGLGPDLLASSNWWDWAKKGSPYADIAVKEMRHFPEANTAPGETCWCLEQGWFWKEGASPNTATQVVDLLTTVNARNSNFLLNVSPDKQGRFEAASVKVLGEVGELLKAKAAGQP
jgi:alpha-L-fucosidase